MATDAATATVNEIVHLQAAHLAELEALLEAGHLPTDDCAEQAENFFGIFEQNRLIAAGGLQPAGEYFLLRSVVVAESCRGRGLAHALVKFLLQCAAAAGTPAVYLLTETAADYFTRFGFRTVTRESVPAAIKETRQFSSLCPDDARCMIIGLPVH